MMKRMNILIPVGIVLGILGIFITFIFIYTGFIMDSSTRILNIAFREIPKDNVSIETIPDILPINLLQGNENEVISYDYLKSSVEIGRGIQSSGEIEAVISYLLRERKKEKKILYSLDIVVSRIYDVFSQIRDSFVSAIASKPKSYVENTFKEARDYFSLRELDKAKKLFKKVILYGWGSKYYNLAKVYLEKIRYYSKLKDKADTLEEKISVIDDKKYLQQVYYLLGNIYTEIGNYDKGEYYFNESSRLSFDTSLVARSKLMVGYVEKLRGRYEYAKNYFEKFIDEYPESSWVIFAKFQVADILRKTKKLKESAQYYYNIAKEYHEDKLSPLAMFYSFNIYYYELKNKDEASNIYHELISKYPASNIVTNVFKEFEFNEGTGWVKKEKQRNILKKIEKTKENIWEKPPFSYIGEIAKKGGVLYALYMIEGSCKQAISQGKDKGDILRIEVDADFLTNWVNYRLNIFSRKYEKLGLSFSNFSIDFPYSGWVSVRGRVAIGRYNWDVYVLSRIYLKKVSEMDFDFGIQYPWDIWVVFEVKEARLGKLNVPRKIIDKALREAESVFNNKQIFNIERIETNPVITIWEGKVRYTHEELKRRLREIEDIIVRVQNEG